MTLWSRGLARFRDNLESLYPHSTVLMATKPGGVLTYLKMLLTLKSRDAWVTWSCEITWPIKTIHSPLPLCLSPPNVTGWWLTEELAIKPHEPSTTWSCKILWQTRIIKSPLPQCLWPPNLAGWWLTLMAPT